MTSVTHSGVSLILCYSRVNKLVIFITFINKKKSLSPSMSLQVNETPFFTGEY